MCICVQWSLVDAQLASLSVSGEDTASEREKTPPHTADRCLSLYDEFIQSLRDELVVPGGEGERGDNGDGEGERGDGEGGEGERGDSGMGDGEGGEGERGDGERGDGEGGDGERERGGQEDEDGKGGGGDEEARREDDMESRDEEGVSGGTTSEGGGRGNQTAEVAEVPLELRDMSSLLQHYLTSLTTHPHSLQHQYVSTTTTAI